MITVSEKNKQYVDSLIREIHGLFSGGGLSGDNVTRFYRLSYVLSGLLYLRGYDDYSSEKLHFIENLLWKRDVVVDLETLKQAALEDSQAKRASIRTEVLFRFHIAENNLKTILNSTAYGKYMRILTKNEYTVLFESSHNIKTQFKNDSFFESYSREGVWCVCHSFDKNHYSAFSKSIAEIELLRALINFKLASRLVQFQSEPMQLSEVSPSKYFFDLVENSIGLFWKMSVGQHKKIDKTIDPNTLAISIEFINSFSSLRNCSLVRDTRSCMYIFQEALDNYQRDYIFILLWTIIDVLIPDIKNNDKLLKNIYRNISREQAEIIDILHNKRNLFVHQGKYTIFDLNDVNYLKLIIEDLFNFCLSASEKIDNTSELVYMLQKIRDKDQTKRDKEIIDYLIEKGIV